jgi:hypothetical protein
MSKKKKIKKKLNKYFMSIILNPASIPAYLNINVEQMLIQFGMVMLELRKKA